MEIKNEKRNINEPTSVEFFSLESKIFSSIYKVCPKNYSEFTKQFRNKYYLSYILDKDELIGFIFLDEILPRNLFYLRVIALSHKYREEGLATKMLSSLFTFIGAEDIILSFVTKTPQLFSVISKFKSTSLIETQKNIVEPLLTAYNGKLFKQVPNSWIKDYYQLADNSYSDGYYFLKKIKHVI
ncbi:MAG: hypothetical protein COC06_12260 [Bacteroidales bacterium]|nr:MAG: hypothetical protein COC06_12260 [Bacteroidales bacterium]